MPLNLKELIALFAGLYNQNADYMEILKSVGLEEKAKAKYIKNFIFKKNNKLE